jgi:hypothetical protein
VVLDMVRRYDIDGVHMDDYFYPYPETHRGREIPFPDQATWRRYRQSGGTLSRGDWRRRNVDLLVEQLNDSIHSAKPWVRFGVSPFGIWRPGSPPSVRGLDQYDVLFADARKWLREGWMDYITPQLYWAVDRPEQSYPVLLRWWAEQNVKGRNLWPGNYTGKVAFTNAAAWSTSEIIQQIRLTRAQPGATGNVHFSMTVFQQNPDSLNERLLREVYAAPALVPATPWLGRRAPARPMISVRTDSSSGESVLEMQPAADSGEARAAAPTASTANRPWLWVVQVRTETGWTTTILRGTERRLVVSTRGGAVPDDVRVTAIDRLGVASPVARAAAATPPAVSGSARRLEE